MDLLLIPGDGRTSNQRWIQEVADAVSGSFGSVRVIRYKHWQLPDGEDVMDVDYELAKVRQALDDLVVDGVSDSIVFAKSAGSVLFLWALADGAPKPVGAVFAGLPLPHDQNEGDAYKMFDIGRLLRGYNVPTTVIQNNGERFRWPREVRESLHTWGVTSCEVVNGTDPGHSYSVDTVVRYVLAQAERVMPR